VLFAEIAATSEDVAATRSRTAKAERMARALRAAAPTEAAVVASWLSGELRQRRTGVGWRSLAGLPAPAAAASLTVGEVDAAFAALAALSGPGSTRGRAASLHALWQRATEPEQRLLTGLVSGELRQGASAGVVIDAVARAATVPVSLVRRALTLHGSLPDVAAAALDGGEPALVAFSLQVGRGLAPMLAAPATLDLVVLAVEHGSGRRRRWLSNLHLGARDPAGGFVMLGKTFKGLTDELLTWQTERLRALALDDDGWVVRVRPELVVEIAFDGVQASPRYPGGVALRFARVVRYRVDKPAHEADTLADVQRLRRA
jgi:ATP-dependent DNA ligase